MAKKNGFFAEFRNFIMRGNVIDMAVGVVVGGAFSKIVSSLVADIITPVISLVTKGQSLANLKHVITEAVVDEAGNITTPEVAINYGLFCQYIIDFIIIAFCIFCVIKTISTLREKGEKLRETPEMLAEKKAAEKKESEKIKVLSVADLIANTIINVNTNKSISSSYLV